jgi:hypothetical protein
MVSAWRTSARSPRMNERAVQRPDCRMIGAGPAKLAAWPASKDEGDPALARPIKRSAYSRSDPRRCRAGSHPLPAVPFRLLGAKSHKASLPLLSLREDRPTAPSSPEARPKDARPSRGYEGAGALTPSIQPIAAGSRRALLPRHRDLEPLLRRDQVIVVVIPEVDLHPFDGANESVPARAVIRGSRRAGCLNRRRRPRRPNSLLADCAGPFLCRRFRHRNKASRRRPWPSRRRRI